MFADHTSQFAFLLFFLLRHTTTIVAGSVNRLMHVTGVEENVYGVVEDKEKGNKRGRELPRLF